MADFGEEMDRNEPEGNSSWLITFADLLSLLLTFFVLVFSMNAVQLQDWQPIVETMRRQFNPNNAKIEIEQQNTPELQRSFERSGLNLSYAEGIVSQWISSDPVYQDIQLNRFNDRLVVSIPAKLFFEYKTADLVDGGESVLDSVMRPLMQLGNKIIVEGHTDRRENSENGFISNWELSLTRARVLAGLMNDRGFAAPIGVAAYADTRFLQFDNALTLQERYDLAERIDIAILDSGRTGGAYGVF